MSLPVVSLWPEDLCYSPEPLLLASEKRWGKGERWGCEEYRRGRVGMGCGPPYGGRGVVHHIG